MPSVILSIAIASVNGYALVNWRFKGSDIFFTILIFGSFIPYQVMLYPIVILLREMGLYGSLSGLILVHTIFGMPILTLLFRNYFSSIAGGAVQGRAGRWRGVLAHLLPDHAADGLPIFVVALILQVTGIWNDFLFGVVYTKPDTLPDDGAVEQHRQLGAGGQGIQRQHGGDAADRAGAAGHLLRLRQTVSSAASPPAP